MEFISQLQNGNLRIVCPACRSGELAPEQTKVSCTKCGASFEVKNGVIDLLPEAPHQEHMWGSALEWNPFVQFYESRWWRRGLVNNVYLAISFDDEFEMIVKAANLKDEGIILDLACGSGIYTRPLARKCTSGTAVGLDLSMPMLDYASAKAQEEEISNLLFVHGDASDLPFPENQFDVVNCCGALHLFPDLPQVLLEIFRVLKPGGHFTGGIGRWPFHGGFGRKFRDLYRQKAGVRGFFREELVSLFEKAGFINMVIHYERRAWFIMSAEKPL